MNAHLIPFLFLPMLGLLLLVLISSLSFHAFKKIEEFASQMPSENNNFFFENLNKTTLSVKGNKDTAFSLSISAAIQSLKDENSCRFYCRGDVEKLLNITRKVTKHVLKHHK